MKNNSTFFLCCFCWMSVLLLALNAVYVSPEISTTTYMQHKMPHLSRGKTTMFNMELKTSTTNSNSSSNVDIMLLRRPRQADSEQVDKCRLFVEGDPEKYELYSPDYPNNYPKNINCTRVITAPKGQIIRLDFRNSFHIEAKEECKFDSLEIRDGQYGFSTLIGKYCGSDFPPEITSKERYLWLHFHSDESIEYSGFTAVYEFIDRNREAPSTDLNCTIEKDGYEGFINSNDVPPDIKDVAIRNKIPLDCMWRIQVQEKWKIQVKFMEFKLSKPNDCETNFLDIFPEQTVMPLRVKNFCGSAGEGITSDSNILHMRFYVEQSAINSTFAILYTAFRDRTSTGCTDEEYDCEDATCIFNELKCNGRDNCKFRWDEEGCGTEATGQSEHVTIIIIVFGLILGGMVITFLVNCVRKIMRDQKIIREHIRQSKESKLDEIGRHSKTRSRDNISAIMLPRHKHSQVSLQILDNESGRYYRGIDPVPMQASKDDIKDSQQAVVCPSDTIPHASCEMGCQTRESLFALPFVRKRSTSSAQGKGIQLAAMRTAAIETPMDSTPQESFTDPPEFASKAMSSKPTEICQHQLNLQQPRIHAHQSHGMHHPCLHQRGQHVSQATITPMTVLPVQMIEKSPEQPSKFKSKHHKVREPQVFNDVRNSAPDVIIMTSH